MPRLLCALLALLAASAPLVDSHGNKLRRAASGHITNFDEDKVGTYVLPDPLVAADGSPVKTAAAWQNVRRPEILELYRAQVYGRPPARLPAVRFTEEGGAPALDGRAVRRVVAMHFGEAADGPQAHLVLYLPAEKPAKRLPVILHLTFLGDPPVKWPGAGGRPFEERGPIADILARGYAYAVIRYTEAQPDNAATFATGIAALAGAGARPADGWSTIGVWSWVASRAVDYFERSADCDGARVALVGHSRLGKTVLWASAQDSRFAVVYSSCAGEMGSSLARRDFGETIDDIAVNFPWQFAPALQRYVGHWSELPVDTHFLIALSAPRPVFITGGTGDLWADPRGEFLAEVAASPVYRLLGARGVATETMPAPEEATMEGDLAFRFHRGPHAIMPEDWKAFLDFADRCLHPAH